MAAHTALHNSAFNLLWALRAVLLTAKQEDEKSRGEERTGLVGDNDRSSSVGGQVVGDEGPLPTTLLRWVEGRKPSSRPLSLTAFLVVP